MEESEILKKLPRVTAPPDFEARLMSRLAERQRGRNAGAPFRPRLWLAAVPAVLLVAAVAVNVFWLRRPGEAPRPSAAERPGFFSAATRRSADVIRITEPMDYRQDIRFSAEEPETVYILESVSDETPQGILY